MLIYYKCLKCNKVSTKLYRRAKDIKEDIKCDCSSLMERQLSVPTTHTTQIVDNGIMQKQVELADHVIEKELDKLRMPDND